jgi:putative toxin-antitoxin system antitoxin component (TIGR02293 family)
MSTFAESSGLPLKDLYEVVIPARTLKHRRARREPLSRDESDKLARLVRVFDRAVAVFGDPERARAWLDKPKKRFGNRTPLAMLRTEIGGRMVEEMLGQIDEGMFA